MSPQTPSRALRALLARGGGKSITIDSRYTEAYGPNEVMLNLDGINICLMTMIWCDIGSFLCKSILTEVEIDWASRHARERRHALRNRSRRVQ